MKRPRMLSHAWGKTEGCLHRSTHLHREQRVCARPVKIGNEHSERHGMHPSSSISGLAAGAGRAPRTGPLMAGWGKSMSSLSLMPVARMQPGTSAGVACRCIVWHAQLHAPLGVRRHLAAACPVVDASTGVRTSQRALRLPAEGNKAIRGFRLSPPVLASPTC